MWCGCSRDWSSPPDGNPTPKCVFSRMFIDIETKLDHRMNIFNRHDDKEEEAADMNGWVVASESPLAEIEEPDPLECDR